MHNMINTKSRLRAALGNDLLTSRNRIRIASQQGSSAFAYDSTGTLFRNMAILP